MLNLKNWYGQRYPKYIVIVATIKKFNKIVSNDLKVKLNEIEKKLPLSETTYDTHSKFISLGLGYQLKTSTNSYIKTKESLSV